MSARRGSAAAPPGLLDPIMALVERIDRFRRGIRPIRPGALLGLEVGRYEREPITLADGTVISPGDIIGLVHFDNARVRQLTATGSLLAGWQQGRGDLAALAAWARDEPPERRPAAYFGEGLHAVLASRVGFEVRPRPRTWYTSLQDWYFRGLIARWSRLGRQRLGIGHGELHASEYWLSAGRLEELHGRASAPDVSRGGR